MLELVHVRNAVLSFNRYEEMHVVIIQHRCNRINGRIRDFFAY